MKIFVFTTYFSPSIGGIEKVMELLANQFAELGHDIVLATLTPGPSGRSWQFPVIRRPSLKQFLSLLSWCDIHLQANLSLKYFFARAVHKGFVVHHGGEYARSATDVRGHLKLAAARLVHGISCSRYIAGRVGCSEVVGNAYDDSIFRPILPLDARDRDIAFLGRLVSQKGCDTLIEALALLSERGRSPSCTIIGDGPERNLLVEMVRSADLNGAVRFLGSLQGEAIAAELNRHRIIAVPSRCREGFGIVALEGLACGCLPIVSAEGGLVDAIGDHGLTFRNGDPVDLADQLAVVLGDDELASRKLNGVEQHLAGFTARRVAERYLEFFERVLARST